MSAEPAARRGLFPTAFVALAALSALCAAPLGAGRTPIRYLDLSQGLAGDKVWDLALDDLGALWAATTTGVSRWDGARFRSFDTRHGLPHANVLRLLRLGDRRIVAGTSSGLAILDPGAAEESPWRQVATELDRGGGQFGELALDARGALWGGSNQGLFRIAGPRGGERLVREPLPGDDAAVRALALDAAGHPIVLLQRGLVRRTSTGWEELGAPPPQLADPVGIGGMATDGDGRLWLVSRSAVCVLPEARLVADGAVSRFAAVATAELPALGSERELDAGVCVTVASGLPPSLLQRTVRAREPGAIVVIGSTAAFAAGPDGVRPLVSIDELTDATILSVLEASADALWVGTYERGLARRVRAGIEIEATRRDLGDRVSTLLARDAGPGPARPEVIALSGILEKGRRATGFAAGARFDVTPPGFALAQPSWGWGAIAALGRDDALWIGVSNGVARFAPTATGGFAAAERLAPSLAGHEPMRLLEAADGALWVSTYQPVGLFRFARPRDREGPVTSHPEIAGFQRGAASAFVEDRAGNVWCGLAQGGAAVLGEGESAFRLLDGDAALPRSFVYSATVDDRDRVWFGLGDGLWRCEGGGAAGSAVRCRREQRAGELARLQCFSVAWSAGRLAAATTKGLYLYDPATGGLDVLTVAAGLPDNNIAALTVAADGSFWVGSDRGVACIEARPRAGAPAPVRLAALSVAGSERPVPADGLEAVGALALGPNERLVEIEVASVDLHSPAPPSYQWRIGDADWSRPSSERRLRFAGLETGTTAVAVRGISPAGVPTPNELEIELRVRPPFYRRAWFVAFVAAAAAALAALAYRVRVARLLALERVRTRIAADLHDDLGSSLSRISILSEVARRQADGRSEAQSTLETIGVSARELAEMASDIVWAIDPQRDDLASWVSRLRRFGEDLFAAAGVRFAVTAPADAAAIRLDAARRRDLYLLAKEALHNAAKYAAARTVEVRVESSGRHLRLVIDDDGTGFDAADLAVAERRGGGRGLHTMRERGKRLGGEVEISARPGGGTRVALLFPR